MPRSTHRLDRLAAGDLVERAEHLLRIAVAVVGRLGHRPVEEGLPVFLLGRQPRHRVLRMHQRQRQRVGGLVGQAAHQQFVGQHADAVEVGAAVHHFAAGLFGRHVAAAAYGETRGRDAGLVALAQRDAEVGEQRPVGVVEQHVLGLDVAVHDAARMRVFERRQQRAQHFDGAVFVLGEVALAQVALGQVGQHVIQQALARATHLVDADDAGMLELGDRARLVLEALLADFVGERGRRHHLHGDLAVQRFLHAQVHLRHAALADPAQHAIAGDLGHVAREQRGQLVRGKLFFLLHGALGLGGRGRAVQHTSAGGAGNHP